MRRHAWCQGPRAWALQHVQHKERESARQSSLQPLQQRYAEACATADDVVELALVSASDMIGCTRTLSHQYSVPFSTPQPTTLIS